MINFMQHGNLLNSFPSVIGFVEFIAVSLKIYYIFKQKPCLWTKSFELENLKV